MRTTNAAAIAVVALAVASVSALVWERASQVDNPPPQAAGTTTTTATLPATSAVTPPPTAATTTSTTVASTTTTVAPTTTTRARPTTTTTRLPRTTTTTSPPATAGSDLRAGAHGPAVLLLEQRLSDLGYWVGSVDDSFDSVTSHAVVAFEKVNGLARDGVAGAQVLTALATAARPAPRSTAGHVVEIDLTHQVLIVADGGQATAVIDVSTGRVAGTTPTGHFTVTSQIDGYHRSDLGVLYRPKYFYGGVAVHGYPSVPPQPASHGCVRTINPAMDWLWASGVMPIGTPVWVYR